MLRRLREAPRRPVPTLHRHALYSDGGLRRRHAITPPFPATLCGLWAGINIASLLRILERVVCLTPTRNITAHVIANRHHWSRALFRLADALRIRRERRVGAGVSGSDAEPSNVVYMSRGPRPQIERALNQAKRDENRTPASHIGHRYFFAYLPCTPPFKRP